MFSKLSISLAAALAPFRRRSGVARANPIPTSTDEARALAGEVRISCTSTATPENGPATSTDQARAEAGQSLPASSGAWVAPMLARDEGEGRAASVGTHRSPAKRSSWRQVLQLPIRRTGATDGSNAQGGSTRDRTDGRRVRHRLKAGGFQVLVWDRTKSKAEALGVGARRRFAR